MKILLSLIFLTLFSTLCVSQDFELNVSGMPRFIDSLFNKGVSENMIPGGIIGIRHKGQTIHQGAYGISNLSRNSPVTFDKTKFQLGSVGKLLTAIAVLREVEKGRLSLDKNVNEYLKEFKIKTPEDTPLTLKHLLLHTGGFNDRVIGYGAKSASEIQNLGEHLSHHMPTTFIKPGIEISYSNYGFGLAGHLVELSSGQNFKEYIQKEIFDVLKMQQATYEIPEVNEVGFAMGYELRDQFNFVEPLPRHVTPAGSLSATGNDLTQLVSALLEEDENLLSSLSHRFLKEQQFTPHELLTGHAFGIEVQNFNGHLGIGKGGNIPGFIAYFILFPQYDFGMFVSVNTETDNFLENFTAAFKAHFFPRYQDHIIAPTKSVNLSDFTGDFRTNRYNRNTIEDLFGLILGSTTIWASSDSTIAMFHNGDYQHYRPLADLIFQNTTKPEYYLVFERNLKGKISKMHRNVVIGGFNIPMTYETVPWYSTVNFINEWAGLFALFILTFLLFPIGWLITLLIRRRNPKFHLKRGFTLATRLTGLLFTLIVAAHIFGSFYPLVRLGEGLLYGVPKQIVAFQSLSLLLPVLVIILTYRLFKVWGNKEGMLGSRVYLTLFTLAGIIHLIILHQWHFIGLNF